MAFGLDTNMVVQVILDMYICASYVVEYFRQSSQGISNISKAIRQLVESGREAEISYPAAIYSWE